MNRILPRLLVITATLASSFYVKGFTSDNDPQTKAADGKRTPISIAGPWVASSSVEDSTCPSTTPIQPIGFPTCWIADTGPDACCLWMVCYEGCPGNMCAVGVPSVHGINVEFSLHRTIVVNSSCSLTVTDLAIGKREGETIDGEVVSTVTALGGNCGLGFPCEVHGTFTLKPPPPRPEIPDQVCPPAGTGCGFPL